VPTGVLLVAERAVTFAGTVSPTPKRILDVGCGYGKYSVLLREYLDPDPIVDGVEAWEPYVKNHGLKKLYSTLYVSDVLDLSQEVLDKYDMVMMGDVIEHIERMLRLPYLVGLRAGLLLLPLLITSIRGRGYLQQKPMFPIGHYQILHKQND
jgi:predicted TPR repeat methyltransferase